MADDSGAILHAPAPNGLPGGYPVRITAEGGEVILPEGLTIEEAIRINEEGQQYDGIDKIDDDGTATYAEKSVAIMKDIIGWDCPQMKLAESEEHSRELGRVFGEFAGKFK